MAQSANPFTPAFGTVPPIMAGRDALLDEITQALQQGNGHPALSSILVGARGTGKTACMTCVTEIAESIGWLCASTSATPGMLEDLYEQATQAAEGIVNATPNKTLAGVTVGPVGASWETRPQERGNWRTRMTRLLEVLNDQDVGLLLTVDEVSADVDEMITLAAVYQHFVRERRKVALLMAGLPGNVNSLVSDKTVSFLRRAWRYDLERIADADVRFAFAETIKDTGKSIDGQALDRCVRAIEGFPYMLQLVGYRTWAVAGAAETISVAHAQEGCELALEDFKEHIVRATYRELSQVDQSFAEAMLADSDESRLADVASRMGVTSSYASRYKARLRALGVVDEPARGIVRFAIRGFRDYVAERAVGR